MSASFCTTPLWGLGISPTGGDLWILPLFGDRQPSVFLQAQFSEGNARFSPDGRWVSYQSDEAGRHDVYVTPFPAADGKWRVSGAGGTHARWRRDGKEIFYLAPDNSLMAAEVNVQGSRFEVGTVRPLFETRTGGARWPYDVTPDGQRFLVATLVEDATSTPITLVVNWPARLTR